MKKKLPRVKKDAILKTIVGVLLLISLPLIGGIAHFALSRPNAAPNINQVPMKLSACTRTTQINTDPIIRKKLNNIEFHLDSFMLKQYNLVQAGDTDGAIRKEYELLLSTKSLGLADLLLALDYRYKEVRNCVDVSYVNDNELSGAAAAFYPSLSKQNDLIIKISKRYYDTADQLNPIEDMVLVHELTHATQFSINYESGKGDYGKEDCLSDEKNAYTMEFDYMMTVYPSELSTIKTAVVYPKNLGEQAISGFVNAVYLRAGQNQIDTINNINNFINNSADYQKECSGYK